MLDRRSRDAFDAELLAALPRLRSQLLKLCRDPDAADDLMQDTMCRALDCWHQYEPGTNMGGWLFTVARNLFRSGWSKTTRRAAIVETAAAEQCTPPSQEDAAALTDVLRLMRGLSRSQREVIEMLAFEGYSYDDVAAARGACPRATANRARRALMPAYV